MQPFPVITEEELKMIERVARRKNNPVGTYKSLIINSKNPNDPPPELPKFLKNNPHPFYLDLWN
jgi:hypothetical protein